MEINWTFDGEQVAWIADIGIYRLSACPVDYQRRGFTLKAKRGTKWRAFVSRCRPGVIEKFGRDCYDEIQETPKAAMKLAEEIFQKALDIPE